MFDALAVAREAAFKPMLIYEMIVNEGWSRHKMVTAELVFERMHLPKTAQ